MDDKEFEKLEKENKLIEVPVTFHLGNNDKQEKEEMLIKLSPALQRKLVALEQDWHKIIAQEVMNEFLLWSDQEIPSDAVLAHNIALRTIEKLQELIFGNKATHCGIRTLIYQNLKGYDMIRNKEIGNEYGDSDYESFKY